MNGRGNVKTVACGGRARRIFYALCPLIGVALAVSLWAVTAAAIGVEMIVPGVGATLKSLGELLSHAEFYEAVGGTLARTLLSFASAAVLAAATAVLSAFFKPVRRMLSPLVSMTRALPTMSVILLAVIWFASVYAPIPVAFIIVEPMLYTAFTTLIDGVDKRLIEMARAYKVSRRDVVFKLYVPSILPGIFPALQSALGLNLKLVIAAEVLAQTRRSIGLNMQLDKVNLDTASLFAWTLAAVALGVLLEGAIYLTGKAVKGKRYADNSRA